MLDFESYYPAAKKYFLSENYRCAPQIVQAAGRVIAENKRRIGKEIVSCNSVHGEVTLREFKNSAEELKGIVEEIASGEAPLSDFALLFRTNGMCERVAEARSHRAGIRSDKEAVSLMTYHASKGLEFNTVYLPSVNEGVIPGSIGEGL